MNRRTLLKSSGMLFGAIGISSVVSAPSMAAAAVANQTTPHASKNTILSANNPLLLNFNENSLGISPKAQEAIINNLASAFRYPDAACAAVVAKLAERSGLSERDILIGNGSSEIIQSAIHAYCGQGTQLVVPDPTFNYAELYAKPLGTKITKIKLKPDTLQIDLAAMREATEQFAGTSVVYLCNPNNPTSTILPASDIEAWINNAPERVFFIVDEAYHEYVTDPLYASAIRLVKVGRKNLIVTRTFSKIYALAGLRMGYGYAAPETIAIMNDWINIDNTNLAAALAASASLDDTAFIHNSLKTAAESRKIVTDALDELNLSYLPSHANFIFHRINTDTQSYSDAMKARHIMVGRPFDHTEGWNRLTLGTPSEMSVFVNELRQLRKEGLT